VRFLTEARPAGVRRAIDLGCGPGFTTDLLARTTGALETWGLDASERMVRFARARFPEGGSLCFAVHDVSRAPYPLAGADVFYTRYLFTHLASPRTVFDACAVAASPGARFLVEDNCALESEDPLFSSYYARVRRLQAHYGQDMFVGERLPEIAAGSAWTLARYERTRIELDGRVMAQLHAINVRTWRHDPYAASAFDASEIDAMAGALDQVAAGRRPAPLVVCTMGQAVFTAPRGTP
jgi:SAM-dependent methyltransferase